MTLADGHHALLRTPSPPLTPVAAQETIPIAIDTSAIATTLLLLHQAEHDIHRHAWPRRRQSLSPAGRRARSHSPSRRSPKLRHTNGRLHADSETSDGTEGGVDGDERRKVDEGDFLLAEQEAELFLLGDLVVADPLTTQRLCYGDYSCPSSAAVDLDSFPARNDMRRSISCLENRDSHALGHPRGDAAGASPPARTTRRFKIFYRDEALRESCAKNTRRMIENVKRLHQQPTTIDPSGGSAVDTDTTPEQLSNQQRLTLKMLRYRKLFDRVHEIDEARLNDPSFDVLECLGAEWCKV